MQKASLGIIAILILIEELLFNLFMHIVDIILTLCLIAIPTGSIPMILSLVKDFDKQRVRWILFRETCFSMVLCFSFLFIGKPFLTFVEITPYAINISGGILIFLISLRMIFPQKKELKLPSPNISSKEPFVFPIATPIISGGGVLATIIVCSHQSSYFDISLAIIVVWLIVLAVMMFLPYIPKLIGSKGLVVVENCMGMILLMRACALVQSGVSSFMNMVCV